MARRKRTRKAKGSNRQRMNMMAAPKPPPDSAALAEASKRGEAVMTWFNSGEVVTYV